MIPTSVQHDNSFLKKLTRVPRGLEKKVVAKHELDPFFKVISLEDLVYTLYEFARTGYLKYEITLSGEYLEWEEARIRAMLDTRPLKLVDPFGTLRQRKYYLAILGREIKTDIPLSAAEISEVIRVLPTDLAEQFLRFRLSKIDQKKLREVIAARPAISKRTPRIDNHYTVGIKELVISGGEVTYKRKPVPMNRRQKEFLRMFLEKPEATLLSPDRFINNPEIFKPDKTYDYPAVTLSKLVSETRQILKQTVGECIFRDANGDWYLRIE
jgi:hypothetical protein